MVLQIIIGVILALLGAVFGHYLTDPEKIPNWITKLLSKPEFHGDMYCVWRSDKSGKNPWICDRVRVRRFLGRLSIRVVEPGDVFNYKILCDISRPYLIGKWRSLNQDSFARGAIMLKMLPQGNIWVGYALGTGLGDKIFPQAAIFAHTKEEAWKHRNHFEELL